MAVAVLSKLFDFLPVALLRDVQRNPAVVANVLWNCIARIRGQQAVLIDAHPKAQRQSRAGIARDDKSLLSSLPHGMAKLAAFAGFGIAQADLAQFRQHGKRARRLEGVDLARGQRFAGRLDLGRLADSRAQLARRDLLVTLAHQRRNPVPIDAAIQNHTQPAARPHIGWNKEMFRLRLHVQFLRARWGMEPHCEAPVAIMIDNSGPNRFTANARARCSLRYALADSATPL